MHTIDRFVAFFMRLFVIGFIAAAIGAILARRRIVPIEAPDADEIRLRAIFEPLSFHSAAPAFRGGEVDCWYGGGIIDLRDAVLDPAGARLQVRAVFGGAQIVVPETWSVTTRVLGIGGIGDSRKKVGHPDDAPHLTIEGYAAFGGFAVVSEVPEAQVKELNEAVAQIKAHRKPAVVPPEAVDQPVSQAV
jgi:hypothetical protein